MRPRRPALLPLVPLYRAGVAVKNALYDRGTLRSRSLQRPVISIGSLSAGGAGKTPVVLMLARLLEREGIALDVLTRGYGRGSGAIEKVDPNGTAQRFGDEPLEMAREGLQVFVGALRYQAGQLAESTLTTQAHLLDDGFQHRQLARSLNLVLLTRQDVADQLLPAGNLREPLASLRRADILLVREDEAAALAAVIAKHTAAATFTIRRTLELPATLPQRAIAFCALARPENFLAMLTHAGCQPSGAHCFPDHHAYTPEDIHRLLQAAQHLAADGFLTTAKDAVKLTPAALQTLQTIGPVVIAKLRVELLDEPAALHTLRKAIGLA